MPKDKEYGGKGGNNEGPNSPNIKMSKKSNHQTKDNGGSIPAKGPKANKMFAKQFKGTTD